MTKQKKPSLATCELETDFNIVAFGSEDMSTFKSREILGFFAA